MIKISLFTARTDFPTYLEAGIEIFEFQPGFVHSKVVLVDDKKATVGTVNMDFRSFILILSVVSIFTITGSFGSY